MKKSRITKCIVIMWCLVCVLLTACGSKKNENALVGKWSAVRNEEEILIFNDDGTYMYDTPNGNNASGSYKVSDNEIQMTSDASGLGADMNHVSGVHEFTLDGESLLFSEFGAAAKEYTKVK